MSFRINENSVNKTVDNETNEKDPRSKIERSKNTKTIKDIKEKNLETDFTEKTNEDKDNVEIQTGNPDKNRTKDTNNAKNERENEVVLFE